MKNRNKTSRHNILIFFMLIAFCYGVGVGRYHWFPFDKIKKLKNIFSDKEKIKYKTNQSVVYEILRDDIDYYVIVLSGQSNMTGRGDLSNIDEGMGRLPVNVDYYNFGFGSNLKIELNRFGPEIGLANELHLKFPNKNFVLIKYSVGGSSLCDWSPEWEKNRTSLDCNSKFGPLYKMLLEKIRNITSGKKVSFAALVWMQGETDARMPEAGKNYFRNFSKFIESFRRDLEVEDLPVLIGHVNPPPDKFPAVDAVRNAQERAAKEIENVQLINTEGLQKLNDNLHYSSQGQLELGRRFADSLGIIIARQDDSSNGDGTAFQPRY